MGLIGKLSEMRMKDPAEGVLRVTGITMPDPTATSANYRLDGVVSADGLLPTPVVHHGMTSTSRWPSPGDELPVTVDRAKPERLVVHWKELPTGQQTAQQMAQQLAAQMRGESTGIPPVAGMPGATTSTTVMLNGQPVDLSSMTGQRGTDLNNLVQAAMAVAGSTPGMQQAGAVPTLPTVSNAEILASGLAGHATLLGTFPPPAPVVKEGRTGVGLMFNVLIDGRPPYQVQNVYAVPNDKLTSLTPGNLLPVKVNPGNPQLVAVDWDAIGR
ncbi:MAG TPA: hypothetical protein VG899_15955 [Mycobacteriales bacterium]|nr:hypothetical protein [Mycobacteriales bacterium]